MNRYSKVYLIGAGPGDPELLTLKGERIIKKATIIIYDNLVNPQILELTKENCEKIYVGKKANQHTLTQDEINELLVEKYNKQETIVRLKGGDPIVFGRGGEEAEYLKINNIPFEIIPGITSSISAPIYAGIPVTHRKHNSMFTI
ncbi:MAG: uroporphyrinogen-III C-methyltransferase, partial [Vampirovibrionia bacterium]